MIYAADFLKTVLLAQDSSFSCAECKEVDFRMRHASHVLSIVISDELLDFMNDHMSKSDLIVECCHFYHIGLCVSFDSSLCCLNIQLPTL